MAKRSSVSIEVTAQERQELRNWRKAYPKKRYWVRADIVLRAAAGQTNLVIARELGISRNTVKHWRYRFARERLAGLNTRPIPGRPRISKAPQQDIAAEGGQQAAASLETRPSRQPESVKAMRRESEAAELKPIGGGGRSQRT